MGDEPNAFTELRRAPDQTLCDIVSVLQTVYGGGYINRKMTFEERKQLRAKAYRSLKALGLEH